MKKQILYAEANYQAIVRRNGYFVDKTAYIEKLEQTNNPLFLRPRRFGKSLLCTMLESYYSILYREQFDELFGHTWIGQNPTHLHNSFIVLNLDFSTIAPKSSLSEIEEDFNHACNLKLDLMVKAACKWFIDCNQMDSRKSATANMSQIIRQIQEHQLPPLYVIIDEYDDFANQLMADEGFLKTFFKLLKEGRKTGAIQNVFITGVLPITMDEMASGFNIASFITLEPTFENMLGFTQTEVDHLLDEIYEEYHFDPSTRAETDALIKSNYNGYHFVNPNGEAVYNSTLLIYFLDYFTQHGVYPEHLTDVNLKTDLKIIRHVAGFNPENTKEFVSRLICCGNIAFDRALLFSQFNISRFSEKGFFPNELCSRHLSPWFTWNVERSYPSGRTDLEFVGKYSECFAGVRMVIAFKYFSNAAFQKLRTTIDDFKLQDEDVEQIAGYVEGLKGEYPEAKISQHVFYCFGNQGYRVFDL